MQTSELVCGGVRVDCEDVWRGWGVRVNCEDVWRGGGEGKLVA